MSAQLSKDRNRRNEYSNSSEFSESALSVDQTDLGQIPRGWGVLPIKELFGFLPTASNSRADLGDTGDVAYVHYGDIHTRYQHFVDFSLDSVPRLQKTKNVSAAPLRDGDLIVADASEDEVGVGKSVEVRNLGENLAISGLHTLLLRPRIDRTCRGYRAYLLENSYVRSSLLRVATGLKVFGISKRALQSLLIPLPPLAEQRAMAEALSDVDGLLGALEALIAKKRAIKQGVMQQLLTGKTRLPGFGGEWETKRLGDIAEMTSGGTPPSSVSAYYDGGIPWVSITDITSSNKVILETERTLTHRGIECSAARILPAGTVLYAMYASIGECAIAGVSLCTSQAILGIEPTPNLDTDYLYHWLVSMKAKVKSLGQQGTQSNLNKGLVQDLRILLPSRAEQASIAAFLSNSDTEMHTLERHREKVRSIKHGMMQQLLSGRIRLLDS